MIKDIFKLPIYKTKYQDVNYLKKITQNLHIGWETSGSYSKKFFDTYLKGDPVSTDFAADNPSIKVHESEEFAPINDFILKHANLYWKKLEYLIDHEPKIFDSVVISYSKDGYTESHNHYPGDLVCVLYLQAEAGSGDLILENPNEILLNTQPYTSHGKPPNVRKFDHREQVETGTVIMFPSWVKHRTDPNPLNTDRIICSFELDRNPKEE